MNQRAKLSLFLVLGLLVGAGVASLVFATAVIPKFNQALDDDQKNLAAQKSLIDTLNGAVQNIARIRDAQNGAALTQAVSDAATCNAKLLAASTTPAGTVSTVDNSSVATIIFEPTPKQVDVHLSVGMLHGLNLSNLPTFKVGSAGQMGPHWVIPARVVPVFIGDSRGAKYYFFADNQLTGPFEPTPMPTK